MRDSFVSVLEWNSIRQRLLENSTLDLNTVFNKTRPLELAHIRLDSYHNIYETSDKSPIPLHVHAGTMSIH